MKEMRTMGYLDVTPVFDCPLASHMATWVECMRQSTRINIETWLQAHTELGHVSNRKANRTGALVRLGRGAPIVIALNMAALEVNIRLMALVWFHAVALMIMSMMLITRCHWLSRDDKRIQTNWALRSTSIQLIYFILQRFLGR